MGSPPKRNTYIHGVEEWNNIPNRLADKPRQLKIVMPDGHLIDYALYDHRSPVDDISENYGKLLPALLAQGIAQKGQIGDAESYVCDAVGMANLTTTFLQRNPDLFLDNKPIPVTWYAN
jgi:aminoglycoside 3-N-acetyltransferase